jgi:hypothetical protein
MHQGVSQASPLAASHPQHPAVALALRARDGHFYEGWPIPTGHAAVPLLSPFVCQGKGRSARWPRFLSTDDGVRTAVTGEEHSHHQHPPKAGRVASQESSAGALIHDAYGTHSE